MMIKLLSLIMALAMALTLAVPAMAYTISAPANGHTYEVYQIFTGDLSSDGVLSNVKWGKNGKGGTEGAEVPDTVLNALAAVNDKSDSEQLAVITQYADLTADKKFGTVTSAQALNNVPAGYYLIKDVDGAVTGENDAYTTYIVKVVNDVTITSKSDVPVPDKKIVEGQDRVIANTASIGDTVTYEITGTLPTNIADYNTYYYVFTDTLSKGLTYGGDNSVAVTVGGVDVTDYFYVGATDYNETTGTTITIGIQDLLALENLEGKNITITKDTKVVVTYTATLNENAVIAGAGNPNVVVLDYSNDPNHSGDGTPEPPSPPENPPAPTYPTGKSPVKEVVTYTTELTILKTDENQNVLTGAEFKLTGDGVKIVLVTEEKFVVAEDGNGEYWKLNDGTYTKEAPNVTGDETDNSGAYDSTTTTYNKTTVIVAKGTGQTKTDVVGAVDENGLVTFKGLGAGKYTITETKTPAGYNTIDPIDFTITFVNGKFVSDNDDIVVGDDNMLDTTIVNNKGATLPETGGMGTTLFYALGAALVLGAGVAMVTKKRMA